MYALRVALQFTKHSIHTRLGVRVVHVCAPSEHILVGKARLEELRAGAASSVDQEIVDHARAGDEEQLFVFRGRNDDGSGSWGFDGSLDDEEKAEVGLLLVKSQLSTYRQMVAAGVFALIHADWPKDAVAAYEDGTADLLAELEQSSIREVAAVRSQTARDMIDRWILSQMTFFYTLPFEQVVREVLRQQLPLLEQGIPSVRALLERLDE